jgi:hypothetical protein
MLIVHFLFRLTPYTGEEDDIIAYYIFVPF